MKRGEVLGDVHNFGQAVCMVDGGRLFKPRTLFWEQLFLSKKSVLRSFLYHEAKKRKTLDLFASWPDLSFEIPSGKNIHQGGYVSFVQPCQPISLLNENELLQVGATLAICAWFGISDLHNGNIVLGYDQDLRFIFAPIDIESVLDDFVLLSQTHFLPTDGIDASAAGLRDVIRAVKEQGNRDDVATIVWAYLAVFDFLSLVEKDIEKLLLSLEEFKNAPCRLIFRPTAEYFRVLEKRGEKLDVPLCDEEHKQLGRGDIPYFFREPTSVDIYSFSSVDCPEITRLPDTLTSRLMRFARPWQGSVGKRQNLATLRKSSVLQIARVFDNGVNCCKGFYKEVEVCYRDDEIRVFNGTENLKVRRLL